MDCVDVAPVCIAPPVECWRNLLGDPDEPIVTYKGSPEGAPEDVGKPCTLNIICEAMNDWVWVVNFEVPPLVGSTEIGVYNTVTEPVDKCNSYVPDCDAPAYVPVLTHDESGHSYLPCGGNVTASCTPGLCPVYDVGRDSDRGLAVCEEHCLVKYLVHWGDMLVSEMTPDVTSCLVNLMCAPPTVGRN